MDNIFLNIDDAINHVDTQYRVAMSNFDKWASQNPEKLDPINQEFRKIKQEIKLLRLKKKELCDMKSNYQNTLFVLQSVEESGNVNITKRGRNGGVQQNGINNKLGFKRSNQISN